MTLEQVIKLADSAFAVRGREPVTDTERNAIYRDLSAATTQAVRWYQGGMHFAQFAAIVELIERHYYGGRAS